VADEELFKLGRELRAAAALAPREVADIVKKAAQNIKTDWQARMRARSHHGHIPHLPKSIGYDIATTKYGAEAVIGPDKQSSQGPLAHLLEFGSVNNPPHNDGGAALRTEAPKFYGAIAKAEGGFLR
jgi:hypothetical protein